MTIVTKEECDFLVHREHVDIWFLWYVARMIHKTRFCDACFTRPEM